VCPPNGGGALTVSKARIWAALIVSLLVAGLAAVPSNADTADDLRAMRDRLGELRGELNEMAARLAEAQTRLARTESRIAAVEREISGVRAEMAEVQRALSDRARLAYVSGGAGTVELLLSSGSFEEFSDRVQYLGEVAQGESDLLIRARVSRERLRRLEEDLNALRQEQRATAAALAERKAALAGRLDQVAAEVADLERRLARERAAARAQEAAAAARQAPAVRVVAGGALQACPVGQPRAYSDDFGAPRSGGRTHQGNDIIAPMGTPVYAAQSGRFEQSYNGLGGISALVYAPNGDYTYYAHLSSYAGVGSGSFVSAGTQIGHVGNTGNASGGITHLHFEYHPGGGGAANPYPHLRAVCG
jgi:murein DD-endopeptidase MepM/ murein hydrolase activator NlpD